MRFAYWIVIGLISALLMTALKVGGDLYSLIFREEPVAVATVGTGCILYDINGKRLGPCPPGAPSTGPCYRYGLDGKFIERTEGPCKP